MDRESLVSVHTNSNIFYGLVEYNPVKLETSGTVKHPPTMSVL